LLDKITEQDCTTTQGFCDDCGNVVGAVCKLYSELLTTQLRLFSKLGDLGGLVENSKKVVSSKLERVLIRRVAEQMGMDKVSRVDQLRCSLMRKCKSS